MAPGIFKLFGRKRVDAAAEDNDDQQQSAAAATKAHLGEANKFYFNKDLGRWVVKGEEHLVEDEGAPPPPPKMLKKSKPDAADASSSDAGAAAATGDAGRAGGGQNHDDVNSDIATAGSRPCANTLRSTVGRGR